MSKFSNKQQSEQQKANSRRANFRNPASQHNPQRGNFGFKNPENFKGLVDDFQLDIEKVEGKLKRLLAKYGPLITFSSQTRYWLTEFMATEGIGLVQLDKSNQLEIHLFLDGRYYEAAKMAIKRKGVRLYKFREEFIEFIKESGFSALLLEADYMNVNQAKLVREWVGRECMLYDLQAADLRILKHQSEIKKIQRAVEISLEAFKWLRINVLLPGVSEEEAARALVQKMYALGAQGEAFAPIIAFGSNTANPHHASGHTKLLAGDLVTVDYGAKFGHFCADITRTFLAPGRSSLPKKYQDSLRKIWDAVNISAYKCREAAQSGVPVADLDALAYELIDKAGFSKYWKHSLGHGVGLDIHESPRLARGQIETLAPGIVFTIEPGVYVPGFGGARIEDTLYVSNQGSRILSRPYLYQPNSTYTKEFDLYDINQLVSDMRSGKIKRPQPTPQNRDLIALINVYERSFEGDVELESPLLKDFQTPHQRFTKEPNFEANEPQVHNFSFSSQEAFETQPPLPPQKPRRGRPPKKAFAYESPQPKPNPKRRGRPPKHQSVTETLLKQRLPETPKRRGRPPKNPLL